MFQCTQVFHSQDVVGLAQHFFFSGVSPGQQAGQGRGVGSTAGDTGMQLGLQVRSFAGNCKFLQLIQIIRFCAKGQMRDLAQQGSQTYAATGEFLGASAGIDEGQLQCQIDAAGYGQAGFMPFIQQ